MKVLFALGATVTEDLDGALKIEELWDGVSGDAQKNRMGQGASVVREGKVTSVSLIEHQWVQGGDQTDLFEGTAAQGTEIVFDDPMYNLTASGFSILERGANYAKLSAGSGTLRGTAYVHNTRLIETKILNSSTENVISVEDQTLISLVNSFGAAKRLANYYKCLETIDAPLVYNLENPGELLTTYHPFDKTNVSACIKTEEITMSNKLKSQSTLLVGFTPIRQEGSESYEYHVVLTGSGTFTFPEGTTSARAVLIGAGGAGFDGSPGGDSTETWEDEEIKTTRINLTAPTTSASDSSNVSNRGAGTPGNGGAGGAAGTPGKVYEVTFSPSSGSRISYACGVKGTSNGALGGATTFGSYSSNSGSTSSAGYTDIITGITYAKSGDSGADGGKGGSGADGESVGDVSGGKQEPSGSATRSDSDTQRASSSNMYMDIDATANFSLGAAGGGGAGGNSGSNSGTPGGDAEVGSVRLSITTGYINAFVYPNKGGTGGDGADGADASVYGCSGSGAGGGGGAGGDSSASSNVSAQYYVYNITTQTRTDFSINNNAGGAAVRKGGAGGKGGAGADGCIILYYGVTTPVQDGQLKDKNGLMLLDKYGRRLIV